MRKKRAKKKRGPPSSYDTRSDYFPTEQVGIVKKMKKKKIDKMRRVRKER